MTRLLFLLPSLESGGAERVAVTLLRHIDRSRFEPHLALLSATGPLLSTLPEDIVPLDLACRRARYALPGIVRAVGKLRPDAIFSTLGHLNHMLMLARPLLPRTTRLIARESIVVSRNERVGMFGALRPLLYRTLYPRFDAVICQSQDMRDDLIRAFGLPAANMHVIPNPVDMDRIARLAGIASPAGQEPSPVAAEMEKLLRQTHPKAEGSLHGSGCQTEHPSGKDSHPSDAAAPAISASPARRDERPAQPMRLSLPADRHTLVFAGRLHPQKGLDLLLHALARLPRGRHHLLVLGDGSERDAMHSLCTSLGLDGDVTFAGFTPNPYEILHAADLHVLPSRFEGFPNVVLEANACGTPTVAFRCPGGLSEIITPGLNGLLAAPESPAALAECIAKAAERDWDAEAIRRCTAERYAADTVTRQYEAVFTG